MFSTKPWDVYVEQLLPIGYGHPLWSPEPISTGSREVLVGDVGWLKEGEFRALFNTTRDEDDAIHQELGVPRDFTVFSPSTALILRSDKITAPMVFSRSISASEAQADASIDTGVAPTSAGVGWRFQTRSDAGALLLLSPPGVAEDAMARRHIVNYMRSNFDSWLEFANASNSAGGLDRRDLRASDLLFICGTLKTTQWAVAAFHGSEFRNKQGQIGSGRVQGPHGLETRTGVEGFSGIQVHIGDTPLPDEWCKAGPARRPTAELESHANQCLFIHYYKMKRRFLLSVEPMLAAAGPDRLPPGPQDPSADAKVPCQAAGASACDVDHRKSYEGAEAYDPVSDLLDYILQASTADIAIASDLDLITLCRDWPIFPDDVRAALVKLAPSVEVDDHGVGTLCAREPVKDSGESSEGRKHHHDIPQRSSAAASDSPGSREAASDKHVPPTRTPWQGIAPPAHWGARFPPAPHQGYMCSLHPRDGTSAMTVDLFGEKRTRKPQECGGPGLGTNQGYRTLSPLQARVACVV